MAYNVKQIQEKKNGFHKAEYTLEINENGKNKTSAPKKNKKGKKEELGFDGKKRKSQKMEFSNQTQLKKIELFLFG